MATICALTRCSRRRFINVNCYSRKDKLNGKIILYAFLLSLFSMSARGGWPYFVLKHLWHSILTPPLFQDFIIFSDLDRIRIILVLSAVHFSRTLLVSRGRTYAMITYISKENNLGPPMARTPLEPRKYVRDRGNLS